MSTEPLVESAAESAPTAAAAPKAWRPSKRLMLSAGSALLGALVVIALLAGFSNSKAKPETAAPSRSAAKAKEQHHATTDAAEALLLDLYEDEQQGLHQQALARAAQLTDQFPHFQLAQLVYAELLNLSLNEPLSPESVGGSNDKKNLAQARLQALLQELRQRKRGVSPPAPTGWLPSNFVQLAADQPYAVAVDISKSRLYLFANKKAGSAGDQQAAEMVADVYVTAGLQGVGKQVEGDAKTPEGVYFIGNKPPNRTLPDLYGSGALTLNYPNALDNVRGKTGSGIWLHGTPSLQYSRPPLDSDGCIVLSNADMKRLQDMPGLRGAPIVMAKQLDWVEPGSLQQVRDDFLPTLQRWHQDWQQGNDSALKAHYSDRFKRSDKPLASWWPQLVAHGKTQNKPLATQLKSILRWKDQDDHMVVTLQDANNNQALWRLYWAKEGSAWKVLYEGPAHSAQATSEFAQR